MSLEKNRGKGHAIRHGIQQSTGDVILIQDADLEYSPKDIPALIQPITSGVADAVFGSRFTGHCRRAMYFWHAVANRLLTLFSNMFNDLNLTDIMTGYKAIEGELARSLRLTSDRFGVETELTARLAKSGARVFEVPISYAGRSYLQGKKILVKDGIAAFFHLLRFGVWDTEPFGKGLMQTLFALEKASDKIYVPILKRSFRFAAPVKKDLRILEVGSGTGTLTQVLVNYGTVVASDISEKFVEILDRRFRFYDGFQAVKWDAGTPLPMELGKFDVIVAFNVLEMRFGIGVTL